MNKTFSSSKISPGTWLFAILSLVAVFGGFLSANETFISSLRTSSPKAFPIIIVCGIGGLLISFLARLLAKKVKPSFSLTIGSIWFFLLYAASRGDWLLGSDWLLPAGCFLGLLIFVFMAYYVYIRDGAMP